MSAIRMYDPPSGWRYDFPKQYKPLPGETCAQTLIRDGYPKEDAQWAVDYTRFWTLSAVHTQGE